MHRWQRACSALGACLVLSLAALAGTAQAQGVAGYTQVTASGSVGGRAASSATATCPTGDFVVGGGFSVSNSGVTVVSSQPANGGSWVVGVTNGSAAAQTFTVTADCAASGSLPGYEQKSQTTNVPAGQAGFAVTATCSSGNVVVGGGFNVGTLASLNSSEPEVSSSLVNNAWTASVNTQTSPQSVTANAICVSSSLTGYEERLNHQSSIPGSQSTAVAATCSTGNEVLGGGFLVGSASSSAVLDSEPVASGKPSTNTWTSTIDDLSSTPETAESLAVCATPQAAPLVTGISPSSGNATGGTTVTITGSAFTLASAVSFGSTPAATFTVNSDGQITAVAPAGTGVVDVTVTTPQGTSPTRGADRYSYVPVVSAVSPSSGSPLGGDSITISGSGFTGASAVSFGSTPATSFTVSNDGQITATTPAGTGTVDVTVTTPTGTSATSAADQYSFIAGFPTASTGAPTVLSSTSAAFTGSVNGQGLPTTAHFEYNLDSKYGTVTVLSTPNQTVGSDFSSHAVSASVSGLVPNALYHVRLVASNSAGTATAPDQTFMTAKDPPPPPPVLGQSFNAAPVSGLVFIKPPGGRAADRGPLRAGDPPLARAISTGTGFIPLTEARRLPTGTQVDARHGKMKLIAALTQKHQTENGIFGGAVFGLSQPRHGASRGVATLSLREGLFPGAPGYASCHHRLSGHVVQTLHAADRGRFRSRGGYASATVRGTIWITIDRCDGTLVIVKRGTVVVDDFVHRTTVTLHAGQRYLAKARKAP